MSFNQFRLSSDILKGLRDVKIENPSPLQKKIFNAVKEKKDLVINTQASDSPEIGYLLSLLNEISKSERRQGTKAIILCADAERAKLLDEWIWAVGYHASIESACITEKGNIKEQSSAISAGPVVIIATPSRLVEILENNRMIFREVQQFIVDQAELISDWDGVETISNRIIGNCQRIFTAAKDSKDLREAEKQMLTDPQLVTVKKKSAKKKEAKTEKPVITKSLSQYYINVPPRSKISTLMAHLDNETADSVIIFTASKKTADRLYKIFRKSNKRAVSVHDALNEKTYNERFERFTSGNVQHLIVGGTTAEKLKIDHVAQVINYDVPESVNEYKLRAELVSSGKATKITCLVSKQDQEDIKAICDSLGYAPEEIPLPKSVKKKASTNKKRSKSSSSKKGKRNKSRSSKNHKKKKKKGRKLEGLPRPTFDQLEGGRLGSEEKEQKGVIGFFKKLFS